MQNRTKTDEKKSLANDGKFIIIALIKITFNNKMQ